MYVIFSTSLLKDEAGQLKKHAAKRDWFTLFTWYTQ